MSCNTAVWNDQVSLQCLLGREGCRQALMSSAPRCRHGQKDVKQCDALLCSTPETAFSEVP